MSTTWSVAIKASGVPEPDRDLLAELEDLASTLDDRNGVAAANETATEARFDVHAPDVVDAGVKAVDIFTKAIAESGMPDWPIVRLDVMTAAEQDADLEIPNYPTLLGVAELADELGVSRQRASELASSARFPAPFAKLASGPIWDQHAVHTFMETWDRRPGRPTGT